MTQTTNIFRNIPSLMLILPMIATKTAGFVLVPKLFRGPAAYSCRAFGSAKPARTIHNSISATADPRAEFKKLVRVGTNPPLLGLFLTTASPFIAELVAVSQTYDFLVVDAQHSPLDADAVGRMLTAISAASAATLAPATPAIVRVSGPADRNGIQQALDFGAYGVLVPTVKTADDARMAADAAFYPPLGSRSTAFPVRASFGRRAPVHLDPRGANDGAALMLQVETAACV